MTLKDFLNLYDNWNGVVKINDIDLNEILKCKVSKFMFKDAMYYNEDLMESFVIAFGFFDEELTVRINYSKEEE